MTLSARFMMIETVAGIGEPGYMGDGGPAGAASLNEPKGLAVDADGHLYVADSENHVVRKVDRLTGIITTIAGSAASVHATSDAACPTRSQSVAASEEDPLAESSPRDAPGFSQVADLSGTVRFVTGEPAGRGRFAGDGGPALAAQLNFPTAVAVDAGGNVYIADTMNHRIRMVEAATGIIRTIAGTGHPRYSGDGGPAVSAGLQDPSAIVLDGRGHYLYIADQSNNRIRAVDLRTGLISTVAGNGTAAYNGDGMSAAEACLSGPSGLGMDTDGILYIADTFNGRIRAVNLQTGTIETVAGDGAEYRFQDGEESVSVSRPYGIAVDHQGNIFLTDSDNHLLRMFDKRRRIVNRMAGTGAASFSGDGGSADSASFSYPFGIAIDGNGGIYVADTFNHRVRRLSA
jgi:DNA-binding beta-propeller fold protein YncE